MKFARFFCPWLSLAFIFAEQHQCVSSPGDEYWRSIGAVKSKFALRSLAHSGQNLYIGAEFLSEVAGVVVTNIAKWDGQSWSSLGNGLDRNVEGFSIFDLAFHQNSLYASGLFNHSGSTSVTNFAKWDGQVWSQVLPVIEVRSLVSNGSILFAGGRFEIPGEVSALNIAQWNGNEWLPLGSGISGLDQEWGMENGTVWSLAVRGKELFAGGRFEIAGGIPAKNVAKWDGEKWSALGAGLPDIVRGLVIYQNELYAAVNLLLSGQRHQIAKWNGSEWLQVGTGAYAGVIISSLVTDGKSLYAGGQFTQIGGTNALNVAKWDGRNWSPIGSGVGREGSVQDLACTTTDLYVAGSFETAGVKPIAKLAVWQIPQAIKAEYSDDSLSLSWPEPDTNFALETADSIPSPNWKPVLGEPTLIRNRWTLTLPRPASTQFYRLRQK